MTRSPPSRPCRAALDEHLLEKRAHAAQQSQRPRPVVTFPAFSLDSRRHVFVRAELETSDRAASVTPPRPALAWAARVPGRAVCGDGPGRVRPAGSGPLPLTPRARHASAKGARALSPPPQGPQPRAGAGVSSG